MQFDEMQKIWDAQNSETLYAINESALHRTITRKNKAASRRIDFVERSIVGINGLMSIVLFIEALNDAHNWDFVAAGILAFTVIYILYFRYKRKKGEQQFDKSMLGELDHAIENTKAIIRFTYLMVMGYFMPIASFYILKFLNRGASIEKWLFVLGMFALAIFLVRWERKVCHIPRKKELEALRSKLLDE